MSNKKTKKKVSYAWPVILSAISLILYYAFETSNGFTKLICVYFAATVLLPLTLTYSTNLINSSIAKPKKGYTRIRKKVKA